MYFIFKENKMSSKNTDFLDLIDNSLAFGISLYPTLFSKPLTEKLVTSKPLKEYRIYNKYIGA